MVTLAWSRSASSVLDVALAGSCRLSSTWSLQAAELVALESSHPAPLVLVEVDVAGPCGALSLTVLLTLGGATYIYATSDERSILGY
jgi:hypothetical protein